MRQGSRQLGGLARKRGFRRLCLAALFAGASALLPGPAGANNFAVDNRGNGYFVDHDGIYLAQRIGQCMNGSGPCYFGGQCPGGEYTANRFANGRVFCNNFYPPGPYPPSFFQRLLGVP